MKRAIIRESIPILLGLTIILSLPPLVAAQEASTQTPQTSQPLPVIVFLGQEFIVVNGNPITRYRYSVENFQQFRNELFAAAPDLPACGLNTNASRTWVDIYQQDGRRLNGFCALGRPSDLGAIWFALPTDIVPPSWIYIELTDRRTKIKYKSNLAETTQ